MQARLDRCDADQPVVGTLVRVGERSPVAAALSHGGQRDVGPHHQGTAIVVVNLRYGDPDRDGVPDTLRGALQPICNP